MTATPQAIICKSCAKTVATVSSSGLSPKASTEPQGCDTCQQFRPLYDAMQAADEAYASFANKQDSYRPKQAALVNVRHTHMRLDNFLIDVEGVVEDSTATTSDPYVESIDHKSVEESEPHGTKRPRSSSSISDGPSATPLPSVYGTIPLPMRKRIKFSDSVEFREEYRPSEHYSRNGEAYERGRYAPPEGGEHLDTSGHDKTFLKFTGMKKVGKKWVDVWKEDADDEREDDKTQLKSNDTAKPDVYTADDFPTVEGNTTPSEATPITHMLVRRSGRTPQSVPTYTTPTPRSGRRQTKNMQVLNAKTISATQPIGTGLAITKDDARTGVNPAESFMQAENEDIPSSSRRADGNRATKDTASPYSPPHEDLTGGYITGQGNPETSTASGTAERHVLRCQLIPDKEDRQLAHDKHCGSSETNLTQPEEQEMIVCEAREQLGATDGPLAAA